MDVDILSKLNTSGSGLSISSLAKDLTAATVEPRRAVIQSRIDKAEVRSTALDRLKTQMEGLSDTFAFAGTLSTLTASSDNAAVGVRTTSVRDLQAGMRSVGVTSLATAQVIEFGGFSGPTATVGAGALTVEWGAWDSAVPPAFTADPDRGSATLTLQPGATLTQVQESLNALPGVTARIIDVGDGTFSLGIVSETGAGNAIRLTAGAGSDPGVAALDLSDPTTAQRQAASDARLTVDGILVRRPSNTVDDLIPGLSLTLTAPTAAPAQVGASFDTDEARSLMEGFLFEVNQLKSLMTELTNRGVSGGERGGLAGDVAAGAIGRELDRLLSAGLPGFGEDPVYLSQLGVATQRDGSLTLDGDAFDKALAANPALFESVLRNGLSSTGPGVALAGMPGGGAAPGRYEFQRDAGTGAARLGEVSLGNGTLLDDGRTAYQVTQGPLRGVTITVDPDVTETQIDFGRSLVGTLGQWIDGQLSSSGGLGRSLGAVSDAIRADEDALSDLDDVSAALEARYLSKFAAMESVITMLNSTGDYLTNLMDSFNAQNR